MLCVQSQINFNPHSMKDMSQNHGKVDGSMLTRGCSASGSTSSTLSTNSDKTRPQTIITSASSGSGIVGPSFKLDPNAVRKNNMTPIQEGKATTMLSCYSLVPNIQTRRKSMYTLTTTTSNDYMAARRLSHNRITAM